MKAKWRADNGSFRRTIDQTVARIALVDDHRVVSRSLQAYLDSFPDRAVVGTAVSGEELLEHLEEWQANTVLTVG